MRTSPLQLWDINPDQMSCQLTVLYDGQCEICQACVSWLRVLDRRAQTDCVPIELASLADLHPALKLENCLRELHVVTPEGRIYVGWDAVALLARLFPATWLIGAVGAIPPFRWLGRAFYRFVAANRYALSKCRGGACRVARVEQVRKSSTLGAFWSCYSLGMLTRLPLIFVTTLAAQGTRLGNYARTFRRRVEFLNGKLTLYFLGGFPCDLIPIFFGEQFTMVLYDGVAIDPGSPQMRRSLARHLRRLPCGAINAVVATHQHEEHIGNLNWLATRTGAPLYVGESTAAVLRPPARLPFVRRVMIGQPPPLEPPYEILGDRLATAHGELQVFQAPGHCDDHIVLYDPQEKLLLAGDAFMGAYFSTPNADVDSAKWIETLERLLALDIETLVEGHGHIHTLRSNIPDLPGVVVREDPKAALEKKLRFLRWLRQQIDAGLREGLPVRAIEATCFPWGQSYAWENFASDQMIRLFSLGHFSRTEVVRSFVRAPANAGVLPTVYRLEFYGEAGEKKNPKD